MITRITSKLATIRKFCSYKWKNLSFRKRKDISLKDKFQILAGIVKHEYNPTTGKVERKIVKSTFGPSHYIPIPDEPIDNNTIKC